MNWKNVLPLLAVASFQIFALDTSGVYLRADVGHSMGSPIHSAWAVGSGYRWNENWRTDLTLAYRPQVEYAATLNNKQKGPQDKFDNYSVMINNYYDIDNYSGFVPYVGLGLGYYHNNNKGINWVDGSWALKERVTRSGGCVSFNAGVAYNVDENMALELCYKLISMGDTEFSLETYGGSEHYKSSLFSSEFTVGVIYKL